MPKINTFMKAIKAVKAWFTHRKDRKDKTDIWRMGNPNISLEDESHWPSDTEESVFTSEVGDGSEYLEV